MLFLLGLTWRYKRRKSKTHNIIHMNTTLIDRNALYTIEDTVSVRLKYDPIRKIRGSTNRGASGK